MILFREKTKFDKVPFVKPSTVIPAELFVETVFPEMVKPERVLFTVVIMIPLMPSVTVLSAMVQFDTVPPPELLTKIFALPLLSVTMLWWMFPPFTFCAQMP